MSAYESDYRQTNSQSSSSANEQSGLRSRRSLSSAPKSPRKRRQSSAPSEILDAQRKALRNAKPHLRKKYGRAYRELFEESVTARFDTSDPFYHSHTHPLKGQIGASAWSSEEKAMFYAALERLGQDDLPGIASAIGTKSIMEIRELLSILQTASTGRRDLKISLRDIPAALEVSGECTERLELAGDAWLWREEKEQAKQERERFGEYWLITPENAEKIDQALKSHNQSPPASTAGPEQSEAPHPALKDYVSDDTASDDIAIADVPEFKLLRLSTFLKLSSSIFMNGSLEPLSHSPHWSTLLSPLATKPSIYRTAVIDFRDLVVSLTERLTKASIIQAMSRIRSRRRRKTKGVGPLVRKRDVFAAIDILGMKRNGKERWRGVARRCRLRVFDGEGKSKRELSWNESEKILSKFENSPGVRDMVDCIRHHAPSFDREKAHLEAGAIRSGTEFPSGRFGEFPSEPNSASGRKYEDETSDLNDLSAPASPGSTTASHTSLGFELNTLEDLDREASRNDELHLWEIIGESLPSENETEHEDEAEEVEIESLDRYFVDDWRDRTEYRADWITLRKHIPAASFKVNQEKGSSSNPRLHRPNDADHDKQAMQSSSVRENSNGRRKKRRRTSEGEIPIRGARAYAALQEERVLISQGQEANILVTDDDAELPVQSIEDVYIN